MARVHFDKQTLDLITGKSVTKRDSDGNLKSVFVPNKVSKYPTILDLMRSNSLSYRDIMTREGIHPPMLKLDKSIFKKDDNQKLKDKEVIKAHNAELRAAGKNKRKHMNVTSE